MIISRKQLSKMGLFLFRVILTELWCPRSAELIPQFAKVANLLNELGSPLLLAKIDAERYPKTASALDIKGYPTLLLFTNGTSQPYTGGFTA